MSGTFDGLADAELAAWIEAVRRDPGPPAREVGAAELRRASRERARTRPRTAPEPRAIEELSADGVPVRIYRPSPEPLATIVFLHGGGWTMGDLESHDQACRRISYLCSATVVAVDYRRAPEFPWPAAVNDAVAVVRWVDQHAEDAGCPRPLAVMGDSAGGNLAALACLRLRDAGGPLPDAQALAYPNTDLTLSQPSVRTNAVGWGMDAESLAWFAENWVPDRERRADPDVSPLFADPTGLPSAVIVTAEHDALRDEGDAYAKRLADGRVRVLHRCEAGLVHGFLTLDAISPAAKAAGARFIADLAEVLGVPFRG